MASKTLYFPNPRHLNQLYAGRAENLSYAEQALETKLTTREEWLKVEGSDAAIGRVEKLFEFLNQARAQGVAVHTPDFHRFVDLMAQGEDEQLAELFAAPLVITTQRKSIVPKTLGQKLYLQSLQHCPVVFGVGPAGTGKTYLAVAHAVSALLRNEVEKIILTRPAVEAGEALGFLPGDLREKILPYLRPLYDAMADMLSGDDVTKLTERGIIEIAPLAYMRGRTLSRAYVILDEAQNTTSEQMMMFLTRLGEGSRMIITGDTTQVDLPRSKGSGLLEVERILQGIEGIAFHQFSGADVVRHPIVQRIIAAYDRYKNPMNAETGSRV
ncbi:PhoH family protein [Actomonas aquatica]|uniref:PhoH-like protein n=1 Tax=Actomonas aquatica TaxID=2866162 RepID=A0ABZ1CBV3_9BACT|nr:PhoH family protein [Opitutus sp. WL0086]WRQ89158.1 PhoH family protein [Opitutus sp. WL0086]